MFRYKGMCFLWQVAMTHWSSLMSFLWILEFPTFLNLLWIRCCRLSLFKKELASALQELHTVQQLS